MKKHLIRSVSRIFLAAAFISVWTSTSAQTDKDDIELVSDSRDAMKEFIQTDALMQNLFNNAYGYVVFPSIGKGAFGVGGASGRGTVFERGAVVGKAKMTQVTIGFQVGGQAYREVVFFQEERARPVQGKQCRILGPGFGSGRQVGRIRQCKIYGWHFDLHPTKRRTYV